MNILMHIDSFGSGGAQRQIVTLALGLAAQGHRVEFHTYYPSDHFLPVIREAGIPYRISQKNTRYSMAPLWGLIRHAREMKADAMIAFLRTPTIYAALAGLFLRRCKIVTSEREVLPKGKLPWKLALSFHFHRLADAVTVNSNEARKQFNAAYPMLTDKLSHIINGYSMDSVPPAPRTPDGTLRLLTLASVNARKNALNLAKAVRISVQDRGVPVQIRWAGEPSMVDGVCLEKDLTDAFINEHGLGDHWAWLGLVSDTDTLFGEVDALIHPSHSEGFSNAVAEAMVNGTPVIVGTICDQPDLVNDSQAGLLFDTRSPESIADAICAFHALSGDARQRMRYNARAYAEAKLSIRQMVENYGSLLLDLKKGN